MENIKETCKNLPQESAFGDIFSNEKLARSIEHILKVLSRQGSFAIALIHEAEEKLDISLDAIPETQVRETMTVLKEPNTRDSSSSEEEERETSTEVEVHKEEGIIDLIGINYLTSTPTQSIIVKYVILLSLCREVKLNRKKKKKDELITGIDEKQSMEADKMHRLQTNMADLNDSNPMKTLDWEQTNDSEKSTDSEVSTKLMGQ
ncbi:hypothetical protein CHS0354_040396 [Potamilus streckersoni]|uniref:Uncharacterized protein n=1 Tax=Potamilus streckersoni TaxID=2493646 RepID=A0AAE0VM83_9BIVA|nr:hypothetical protein CHS0354_040396 [Potamilus streckersoni]